MADSPLSVVTDYLRAVSARTDALTEAELLAEYACGSADAFAVLVRRHGPMVLGVCRRTLGPTPDADDAFQATFLSLARAARRITDTVPGWLFRVATRTARKALRRTTVPFDAEEPAAAAAPDDLEWREVRRLLDEELGRLPDQWRAPLVLCYLDGLTRAVAARRLGWSVRTLHRRLDEGRERLRTRLERRGLAPALLAAAVFGAADARAAVPPVLARETVARETGALAVPSAVRSLIYQPVVKGALAMKLSLTGLVLAGGLVLAVGGRQPVSADPPTGRLPTAFGSAPIPKAKAPPDPIDERAKVVRTQAVAYLIKEQTIIEKGVGSWESEKAADAMRGGVTALALVALMESGVAVKEDVVARGLAYLRALKPTTTYVVSLQTQALCRANQKDDADRIKKNVEWLEQAAGKGAKGELVGWSYTVDAAGRADNSNTRYAVAALFAAHEAGFRVAGKTLWADVRDLFIRTQKPTGGWGYVDFSPGESHTMTVSGLVCLTAAERVLKPKDDRLRTAREAGESWLADHFKLEHTHTYYNFDVVANYGRLGEVRRIGSGVKKRDWFREGVDWLEKKQADDGRFPAGVGDLTPVVSTSFALRFLASRVD